MLDEDAASLRPASRAPHQAPARSDAAIPPRRKSDQPSRVAPPRDSSATGSLLSPEDVARRCGVSRKAVYRAISRGELRAARILSRLRIDPRDVEAWIRANIVDDAGSAPAPAPARARLPAAGGLRRLLLEP